MTRVPFSITYSPDDADSTGKGWYAQTFDPATGAPVDDSDLFESKAEAVQWVRAHKGDLDISCGD